MSNIVEELDQYYKVMNWNNWKVKVGPGYSPQFLNLIQSRRTTSRSNLILITGEPGEGKSYAALSLAEILDSKFNVWEQVVFTREHFLELIGNNSPLKRGQVIVVDEAQFIAGVRTWYDTLQIDLMNNFEAVRFRGYIIIIVALHMDLLDKILRRFVLTYMINIIDRGKGVIYRLFNPAFATEMYKNYIGKIILPLPDVNRCPGTTNMLAPDCLTCEHLFDTSVAYGGCLTDRAIYERLKHDFIGQKTSDAQKKAEEKKKQESRLSQSERTDLVWLNRDKLKFTSQGNIDWVAVQIILENEADEYAGSRMCRSIAKRIQYEHNEWVKRQISEK